MAVNAANIEKNAMDIADHLSGKSSTTEVHNTQNMTNSTIVSPVKMEYR